MRRIAIIGGGASGLVCAIMTKKNSNANVTIFEKNAKVGKKILQTGNGKCNLTNLNMNGDYYNNSYFVNKGLDQFPVKETLDFFKDLGLMVRIESDGRVYPYSLTATTVLDVLRDECERLGIEIITSTEVTRITSNGKILVYTTNGDYFFDIAVIATGSNAQASTNGYKLLESLGHYVVTPRPALVALKTQENLSSLQGLRVKCNATIVSKEKSYKNSGEILFKDNGLSGILAFDLSRYYADGAVVSIDLMPGMDAMQLDGFIKGSLENRNINQVLLGMFPKMIALDIVKRSNGEVNNISNIIKNYCFNITGLFGYNQAQISSGGVEISEINFDFSSKIVNNLYIIGEVLDIDGPCGGYNLNFAWMSGAIVGKAIGEKE